MAAKLSMKATASLCYDDRRGLTGQHFFHSCHGIAIANVKLKAHNE